MKFFISSGRELFIPSLKGFWSKPTDSSSLGYYNAIYINTASIDPLKPNHYVYDSFFPYVLS